MAGVFGGAADPLRYTTVGCDEAEDVVGLGAVDGVAVVYGGVLFAVCRGDVVIVR